MNEQPSQLRLIVTDAIRFWEKGRIAYNILLMVVFFLSGGFAAMIFLSSDGIVALIGLLALAVLANLLYCAAYVVDVFVQLSGFQEAWRRNRWILLVFGCLFASSLVYAVCSPIM